jgi:hypothetical protein
MLVSPELMGMERNLRREGQPVMNFEHADFTIGNTAYALKNLHKLLLQRELCQLVASLTESSAAGFQLADRRRPWLDDYFATHDPDPLKTAITQPLQGGAEASLGREQITSRNWTSVVHLHGYFETTGVPTSLSSPEPDYPVHASSVRTLFMSA